MVHRSNRRSAPYPLRVSLLADHLVSVLVVRLTPSRELVVRLLSVVVVAVPLVWKTLGLVVQLVVGILLLVELEFLVHLVGPLWAVCRVSAGVMEFMRYALLDCP